MESEIDHSESSSSGVSSKRRKMDSGSGSGTSGRPDDKRIVSQKRRDIIDLCEQNFAVIKGMAGFVDHTQFIGSFLRKRMVLGIFAPRRFGKSSHLNMTKTFLTCVNKNTGKPYETMNDALKKRKNKSGKSHKSKKNDKTENRANYRIFKDTNIVTSGKYKDIVDEHLGRHPVIHLDLKEPPEIYNVEDAQRHFRNAVQEAYKEHPYLISSEKLTGNIPTGKATARRICDKWCNDEEYKNLDLDKSLINLAKYLYNHFDKTKVYVLIDEFDAINASALRNARNAEEPIETQIKRLTAISKVITEPLCKITKGEELDYIGGVLITGVSYIAGVGYSSGLNNFQYIRFLEGDTIEDTEKFVPFYGATEEEVKNLVQKLVNEDQLVKFKEKKEFLNDQNKLDAKMIMDDLKFRYNGYRDKKDTRIFCLWSVLQYFQTGEPKHFWTVTDGFNGIIRNIFRLPAVAKNLLMLMSGKTIKFKRLEKVHIEKLLYLENLLINGNNENVNDEVVFNFLMDQGYVSYVEDNNEMIKIPNSDVEATFSEMLFDILNDWKFDIKSCAEMINKLEFNEDKMCLKSKMKEIRENLNKNIHLLLPQSNPENMNEAIIMCALYGIMVKADLFELSVDSCVKLNGQPVTSGRPDYLMLHKSISDFSIIWELKLNKKDQPSYTSKQALQEARGLMRTTNNTIKDYLDGIEKIGRKALVVGLSIDPELSVSLAYAKHRDSDIFCIPEEEEKKNILMII